MIIYKINKSWSSGRKTLYKLVFDTERVKNESYIEELIEEVCNKDASGSRNGYSYTYGELKDETEIQNVLRGELKIIKKKINFLKNMENELLNYIK